MSSKRYKKLPEKTLDLDAITIDKILFNSKWSQSRFFIGLENKELLQHKTAVCYQSTSSTKTR